MALLMQHITDYTLLESSKDEAGLETELEEAKSPIVLVLLNYRLPRFTASLWNQGIIFPPSPSLTPPCSPVIYQVHFFLLLFSSDGNMSLPCVVMVRWRQLKDYDCTQT